MAQRLAAMCETALIEGEYEVSIEGSDYPTHLSYSRKHSFRVTSRRFTMPAEDVYSVYPPKERSGRFGECFPHIVLQRDTIPWERRLEGGCPWLALLVFSNDEGVALKTMSIQDALTDTEGTNVYVPPGVSYTETDAENISDACRVVEIPRELFINVLPTAEEISELCHVRQVKLDDKVTDPLVKDGSFSCVASNRCPKIPAKGPGAPDSIGHHAVLVSVEGFEAQLNRKSQIPDCQRVRMFVMAEWTFQCIPDENDFPRLINELDVRSLSCPVDERVKDGTLRQILGRGFVPINHHLRNGGKIVSWYRGPLIPVLEAGETPPVVACSDELLGYDPDIGMMDVSLSAAWELGRANAAKNLSYAAELLRWRYSNVFNVSLQVQAEANKLPADPQSVAEQCREAVKALIERRKSVKLPDSKLSTQNQNSETVRKRKIDVIRQLSSRTERASLSGESNGGERNFPQSVKSFLADCCLLYHVPMIYLLPDSRMLGDETLRFFTLDTRWIRCYLDGSCSIGRNASVHYVNDASLLDSLFREVFHQAPAVRLKLQRREEEAVRYIESPAQMEDGTPYYSGFLLRSALVKGWRGLEFQAFSTEDKIPGESPLTALRLETLGDELLFGIFEGELKRLTIEQPPEGIHFGFTRTEREGKEVTVKRMRSLENGKLLKGTEAELMWKDRDLRVMDVTATKSNIERALSATPGSFTSAEIALELIQNAYTGVFTIKDSKSGAGENVKTG